MKISKLTKIYGGNMRSEYALVWSRNTLSLVHMTYSYVPII